MKKLLIIALCGASFLTVVYASPVYEASAEGQASAEVIPEDNSNRFDPDEPTEQNLVDGELVGQPQDVTGPVRNQLNPWIFDNEGDGGADEPNALNNGEQDSTVEATDQPQNGNNVDDPAQVENHDLNRGSASGRPDPTATPPKSIIASKSPEEIAARKAERQRQIAEARKQRAEAEARAAAEERAREQGAGAGGAEAEAEAAEGRQPPKIEEAGNLLSKEELDALIRSQGKRSTPKVSFDLGGATGVTDTFAPGEGDQDLIEQLKLKQEQIAKRVNQQKEPESATRTLTSVIKDMYFLTKESMRNEFENIENSEYLTGEEKDKIKKIINMYKSDSITEENELEVNSFMKKIQERLRQQSEESEESDNNYIKRLEDKINSKDVSDEEKERIKLILNKYRNKLLKRKKFEEKISSLATSSVARKEAKGKLKLFDEEIAGVHNHIKQLEDMINSKDVSDEKKEQIKLILNKYRNKLLVDAYRVRKKLLDFRPEMEPENEVSYSSLMNDIDAFRQYYKRGTRTQDEYEVLYQKIKALRNKNKAALEDSSKGTPEEKEQIKDFLKKLRTAEYKLDQTRPDLQPSLYRLIRFGKIRFDGAPDSNSFAQWSRLTEKGKENLTPDELQAFKDAMDPSGKIQKLLDENINQLKLDVEKFKNLKKGTRTKGEQEALYQKINELRSNVQYMPEDVKVKFEEIEKSVENLDPDFANNPVGRWLRRKAMRIAPLKKGPAPEENSLAAWNRLTEKGKENLTPDELRAYKDTILKEQQSEKKQQGLLSKMRNWLRSKPKTREDILNEINHRLISVGEVEGITPQEYAESFNQIKNLKSLSPEVFERYYENINEHSAQLTKGEQPKAFQEVRQEMLRRSNTRKVAKKESEGVEKKQQGLLSKMRNWFRSKPKTSEDILNEINHRLISIGEGDSIEPQDTLKALRSLNREQLKNLTESAYNKYEQTMDDIQYKRTVPFSEYRDIASGMKRSRFARKYDL